MTIIKYFLIVVCSLALVGCFVPSKIQTMIDNPTSNEIKVTIDGTEHVIPPVSKIAYSFEFGKHTLVYNQETLNILVKPNRKNELNIINPTLNNYVIMNFYFIDEKMKPADYGMLLMSKKSSMTTVSIMYDGKVKEIELPLSVTNDLFIDQSEYWWKYDLDKPVPEKITIRDSTKFSTIKKIYREAEFWKIAPEYVEELDDYDIPLDRVRFVERTPELNKLPTFSIPDIALNSIACEQGRNDIQAKLNNWQQILTLTGSDFSEGYKDFKSTIIDANTEAFKNCDGYSEALNDIADALESISDLNFVILQE